jgi:hypothetical protein
MEVAVLFEAFYNNNNNNTPRTHKRTTTEDEVGISQNKIPHPYYDGLPCPTALWTTINSTYPTNVMRNN